MGSLLGDAVLRPDADASSADLMSASRRISLDDTEPNLHALPGAGGVAVAPRDAGRPVSNLSSMVTQSQNPVARSAALNVPALTAAASHVAHSQPVAHAARTPLSGQSPSGAIAKQHQVTPTVQSVPVANVNFTAQRANVSYQPATLHVSSLHLTTQNGRSASSTPNFSRYVGITNEDRLDGIALAQDSSGNPILAATGYVQGASGRSILVATIAPDGTAGSSGTITASGYDATGVGIDSDASGNTYISATLNSGGVNAGLALIQIDPSGNVNSVAVLGNTSGSAGYLRFDPNSGLVYFTGQVDGNFLAGTVDSTNWTPSGTTAGTVTFMDQNNNPLVSASHSVVLDSGDNAFYATTVVDGNGNSLPGLVEIDTSAHLTVLGFFASSGPDGNFYDITDGSNGGHETIYLSGTAKPGGADNVLVAGYDEVTNSLGGVTIGATGVGFNGYGIAIDPATGNVYLNDDNYAVGANPEANAGFVALNPGLTTVVDQNSDPNDDIFGSFDDRSRGLRLYNGEIYKAGFTNSPDMNYLAPSSPAFGGTPEGRYDSVWYVYNYM
jgi:hypothetical protein